MRQSRTEAIKRGHREPQILSLQIRAGQQHFRGAVLDEQHVERLVFHPRFHAAK
jgi:hypothetical protein